MKKGEILTEILRQLFEPEKRRLNGILNQLNIDNKKLKGLKTDGFLHRGKFHWPPAGTLMPGVTTTGGKPTLHLSLIDEAELWLNDKKIMEEDYAVIRQMLYTVLFPCQDQRQIRDALPECLVSLVPELKSMTRFENAGWTLAGNERHQRQFAKILPKMEFYSATRLFF